MLLRIRVAVVIGSLDTRTPAAFSKMSSAMRA
jgi:hypothetical protein